MSPSLKDCVASVQRPDEAWTLPNSALWVRTAGRTPRPPVAQITAHLGGSLALLGFISRLQEFPKRRLSAATASVVGSEFRKEGIVAFGNLHDPTVTLAGASVGRGKTFSL